ncbi:MAG: phosphonate C-P lyase system protein PhnH [Treponema sp.]|jgi:phosphonate C-P lyase system protein PhnH|nr:phosphonate C-P lyase system protein PhnH [Treponema sp.]
METLKRKHSFDPVHGAQEMFRILLEALSNPGRVLNFRSQAAQFAGQGRWLAPALTLLDKETGFFWDGDPQTGEEIRFLTGAPGVSLEEADFVFLSQGTPEKAPGFLARVKGGTHLDPHDSALLFITAGEGGGEPGEESVRKLMKEEAVIKGPGVQPEGRRVDLFPAEALWCRALEARAFEYPCGVELILLREDDSLLALTRKTEFLWAGPK